MESRNRADKACLSISIPPPVYCLSFSHRLGTLFFLSVSLSLLTSVSLSPADLWSRLGSQNTSKQLLSNGPLLKQSVARPDEDDWSLTSGSMHSYESLDQPGWRERDREIERERDLSENWYSCVYNQTRHLSNVKTCRQPLVWVWCWTSFGMTTAFTSTLTCMSSGLRTHTHTYFFF